jgi:adenylosuccinate lyase
VPGQPSALSPLDGRYASQVGAYSRALSEAALIKWRFAVEIEWYLALSDEPAIAELPPVPDDRRKQMRRWVEDWSDSDVAAVKEIESRINHDVKAVEYYLKQREPSEFIHFGCTSEDINNLAHSLMLADSLQNAWLPEAEGLADEVWGLAVDHKALPMPSHTHGQPASPTTLGKEFAVLAARFDRQATAVRAIRQRGKANGAVGTFGAHHAAYPDVEWMELGRRFVESFGLEWNPLTTQIEPHDALAETFHAVTRFNTVLLDFCRDVWEYISRGYLRQRAVDGEVGSSTMPHKVNPIDFENAEANAGISNALLGHLAEKLMVSRMQRDLSDSSAIRNVGVALGHSGLAITAARRGLGRVAPDGAVMAAELDHQWEVLAEPIQTVMRRYGLPEPYERLKELTRGREVTAEAVRAFVGDLDLPEAAKRSLLQLTPSGYTGLAEEMVVKAWRQRRGGSDLADRED